MSDLLQAVGWALLHSTWQVGVVWVAWRAFHSQAGGVRARYLAAGVALASCVVLFLATALLFLVAYRFEPALSGTMNGRMPLIASAIDVVSATSMPWRWSLAGGIAIMSATWLVVALLLLLRTIIGWRWAHRSHVVDTHAARASWRALGWELGHAAGMHAVPLIVESGKLDSPAVFGIRDPVIVLPSHGLSQLTVPQLKGIIAHELEHVRRRDALTNVLQCVIDALFCFHPAVASMSRAMRAQRELICDVAGAAACGDAILYVRGLLSLEESRYRCGRLALAARGGVLLERVHHLLDVPIADPRGNVNRGSRTAAVLAMLTAPWLLLAMLTVPSLLLLPPTLHAAATTSSALAHYTVSAVDPAGHFTLTVTRGRAVAATIHNMPVARDRVIQHGDSITVLSATDVPPIRLQLEPRGGISWSPRAPIRP